MGRDQWIVCGRAIRSASVMTDIGTVLSKIATGRAAGARASLLGQEYRADAKPIVDLNSRCDAVHLTFEIHIHQHQVRLMLGGCENGLLP